MSKIVKDQNLVVASVLSGNRNFEGRIQSQVRANYLASPPLVVAYALAGKMQIDLTSEPLGLDTEGQPVYLKDIWPAEREIQETMLRAVKSDMFRDKYAKVFDGDERWRSLPVPTGERFEWSDDSTYIRNPPFFENLTHEPAPPVDIRSARVLAVLGDSVTTDHISPAGSIPADSPAGKYLIGKGVTPADFNSYGARRGNHEVMMRGTFANIRLRNQLAPGTEGGWTTLLPGNEVMTIYDASMRYQAAGVPLLVIAGKEYGSGSSRDWAAKGTLLLGVKAVLAESFERIHRSNLVNMGVLPMCFRTGETAITLKLTGRETYEVIGMGASLRPSGDMTIRVTSEDGTSRDIQAIARIDTPEELVAFRHGGILPYVLRQLGEGIRTLPPSSEIKRQAKAIGFDLCGIAPVASYPELGFLREWLDRGYAGEMQYLHRSAERRGDVRAVLPSARSVIVLGTVYNVDRPYSNEPGEPDRAAVARYAWGDDYHVVIEQRLERMLAWLRARAGSDFEARAYVDTGPVQERVYAQYAGHRLDRQEHLRHQRRARIVGVPVGRHHQFGARARRAVARPVRDVRALSRGVPDGRAGRTARDGRDQVSLVSDDRAQGADSGGGAGGHRTSRLRLRHLPGRLPLEPHAVDGGFCGQRLAAAARPRRPHAPRVMAAQRR